MLCNECAANLRDCNCWEVLISSLEFYHSCPGSFLFSCFSSSSFFSRSSCSSSPVPDPQSIAQWALPDLFQIAVGTAGSHLAVPDRSGHCRNSSAGPDRSGHCRTSTASPRSQWALPDLNHQPQSPVGTLDRSGHCRTSTASPRSQWALPDLNREPQIPALDAIADSEHSLSAWYGDLQQGGQPWHQWTRRSQRSGQGKWMIIVQPD
eukprot:s558_g25.t1